MSKDIDKLLEDARNRAASYGRLYGVKETADDFLKTVYATLYDSAPPGTVPERDSWIKRQPEYCEAVERKRDAYADYKCAETYLRLLFAQVSVYQTNSANDRYLDKAHQ